MSIPANNALETTTSTGTGAITLAGAVTGWQTFFSAYQLGDRFSYCIEAVDGSGNRTGAIENGQGYLSSSTTLVRDFIESSSNSDTFVSFAAGTKYVSATLNARDIQTRGKIYAMAIGLATP